MIFNVFGQETVVCEKVMFCVIAKSAYVSRQAAHGRLGWPGGEGYIHQKSVKYDDFWLF